MPRRHSPRADADRRADQAHALLRERGVAVHARILAQIEEMERTLRRMEQEAPPR